jgi:uncharacterized protein YodC (DUF2158 family)
MGMAEFKPGDLVKLKSGGPTTTVKGTVMSGLQCQWFAGAKLEMGVFAAESLVKAEAEPKKS